jgi:hypothetical protein
VVRASGCYTDAADVVRGPLLHIGSLSPDGAEWTATTPPWPRVAELLGDADGIVGTSLGSAAG